MSQLDDLVATYGMDPSKGRMTDREYAGGNGRADWKRDVCAKWLWVSLMAFPSKGQMTDRECKWGWWGLLGEEVLR